MELDKRGRIKVDQKFRTTASGDIYAIGDVIDGPMLAHKVSPLPCTAETTHSCVAMERMSNAAPGQYILSMYHVLHLISFDTI